MDIRQATATDRDAVIALWEATDLTRPWNDPVADFDRALTGAASTILVGEEAGTLIATVMVGHDGHRGAPPLRGRQGRVKGIFDLSADPRLDGCDESPGHRSVLPD